MNVFDLSARITMDINGYLKGMDTAKAVATSTMSVIGGEVSKFMQSSVEVGRGFDKSMSQVAATMGGTMETLATEVGSVDTAFGTFDGNLREYAQFMGKNTAFSATQAADALNYMALAGYKTQESMDMLPNVLNLAAAGGFDLARASDMITDTQTAFNISAKRTTQMVDEMAKAASTGNTSVEQLGDAFLVVGGLAGDLNGGMVTLKDGTKQSVDGVQELEIALTAMANAGVKGSEAGTHMRNMLLKLSSPTDKGAQVMEELGVKVFDATGNMRSLRDIMGDLRIALSSVTQEEKISAISEIFNARDIASAEALLSAVNEDWDAIGESILNAEGAAQQMADVQLDNLEGDITLFKSALEGMQIALSDAATPALREMTQFATDLIGNLTDAFQALPEPVQTAIGMIGLVGGKVAEMAPMISNFSQSINLARIAANTAGDAAGSAASGFSLLNPVTLAVVAGIMAAVTAFVKFREQVDQNTEAIRNFNTEADAISEDVESAVTGIKELAGEELSASGASEKLATAQANLEALQSASEDASKRAAKGQKAYNESVAQGALQMYDLKESGDIVFDILDGMTNGAMHMAAGMQSVKEATDLYNESTEKLADAESKANAEMWAAQNAVSAYSLLSMEMNDAEIAATESLLNQVDAVKSSPEAYEALTERIAELNAEHYAQVEAQQAVIDGIEAEKVALKDELEEAKQSVGSNLESIFNSFDEIGAKTESTVSDMIGELDKQLEYMKNYSSNMDWLMEQGVDEGLVAHLADGSQESAAILQKLVEDGGAHIGELSDKFAEMEGVKTDFEERMGALYINFDSRMDEIEDRAKQADEQMDLYNDMYNSGMNTIQGYLDGIGQKEGLVYTKFSNMSKMAHGVFRAGIQEMSPSKLFKKSGINSVLGVVKGVEQEEGSLYKAYANLADTAYDAYESNMQDISVESPTIGGANWRTTAGTLAAQIPRSDVRERPQTVNLVLDEQIIGRVLLPLLQGESERVGVRIGGVA